MGIITLPRKQVYGGRGGERLLQKKSLAVPSEAPLTSCLLGPSGSGKSSLALRLALYQGVKVYCVESNPESYKKMGLKAKRIDFDELMKRDDLYNVTVILDDLHRVREAEIPRMKRLLNEFSRHRRWRVCVTSHGLVRTGLHSLLGSFQDFYFTRDRSNVHSMRLVCRYFGYDVRKIDEFFYANRGAEYFHLNPFKEQIQFLDASLGVNKFRRRDQDEEEKKRRITDLFAQHFPEAGGKAASKLTFLLSNIDHHCIRTPDLGIACVDEDTGKKVRVSVVDYLAALCGLQLFSVEATRRVQQLHMYFKRRFCFPASLVDKNSVLHDA